MKHLQKLLVGFLAMGFLGTPALAANTESLPEERRGVVIGGLIGAGVGGPIGAGIGVIVGGGLIGKSMGLHRVNQELEKEVAQVKSDSKVVASEFETRIAHLNHTLDALRSAEAVAKAAPEIPIQFKTGSHAIETHYEDRLLEIANAVSSRPDAKVSLAGFADRRGDDGYNLRLSESRVMEVRDFLMNHGVSARQIETEAYGESRPVTAEENPESFFFDRRVVMRFSVGEDETPLAAR